MPKPTTTELLIEDIDWSPCQDVRERLDEATVTEYAKDDADGSEAPPAEVWEGGGEFYAGDGGHRRAAKLKNGKKKILCAVHKCDSAESALKLARLHAFGPANAAPGLERSPADKRKTVRACVTLYPDHSDREVARMCRVGRWLVGQVRDEIAGRDPNPRRITPVATNAPTGGGRAAARPPHDAGPADGTDPDDSPPAAGAGDPAARPRQSYAMTDAKGREIPESLAAAFVAGRSLVRNAKEMLNEIHEALAAAGDEEWGPGVKAVLPNIEGDFKRVGEDLFGSVPYVLCPHLGPDGTHLYGGVCKFCLNGRGWFTKNNYLQLSDEKRKLFEPESKPQSKPEAA